MNPKKSVTEILKKAALKVTPHRERVLTFLQKQKLPLSHKDILAKMGDTDFDTVTLYRILESFVSAGFVRKIILDSDTTLFEYSAPGDDHHHLVCTGCRTIVDVDGCGVGALIKKALEQNTQFKTVTHHSFELFGLCNPCFKKQK